MQKFRRAEQQADQLPEGRKQGLFMRLLKQLNNILVYVLLAAGFAKLMVGLWLALQSFLAWLSLTHCWASYRKVKLTW
jgi:magnesium-transporting ATPase (P-type)